MAMSTPLSMCLSTSVCRPGVLASVYICPSPCLCLCLFVCPYLWLCLWPCLVNAFVSKSISISIHTCIFIVYVYFSIVYNLHTYISTLDESGYKYKLKYDPPHTTVKKMKQCQRLTSPMVQSVLQEKCEVKRRFPCTCGQVLSRVHDSLRKIFNRNTIKTSYSCISNVKQAIKTTITNDI